MKNKQKRNVAELFEGIDFDGVDISDIAKYLNKLIKNNSDNVILPGAPGKHEDTSELAGYQPYRSGDTQPSTSGKGQGTAGKKIRKTSKDWTSLTFEQYLKWDVPDEGLGASSRSGTELEELAEENRPKIFPQKGTGESPGVILPGSVPGRAEPTVNLSGSVPD